VPELPEVETTRLGIQPYLQNQTILGIDIRDTRLRWPIDNSIGNVFSGKKITSVSRRGKYLLLRCIDDFNLIIHLGMSGSMRIVKTDDSIEKHDHFDILLSNQFLLRYRDPRRFGALLWCRGNPQEHKLLRDLGPEPLGSNFQLQEFYQNSRHKRLPIKQYIMDHHIVVGVGNIYANEALFMAGIRPGKAAGRVSRADFSKLYRAIKSVLQAAIKQGGTTLKDFRGSDGKAGYFQLKLFVYGQNGNACQSCGSMIKEKRIGQRNSYYCPECQS